MARAKGTMNQQARSAPRPPTRAKTPVFVTQPAYAKVKPTLPTAHRVVIKPATHVPHPIHA